jgi:hypothetical protein
MEIPGPEILRLRLRSLEDSELVEFAGLQKASKEAF